MENRDKSGVLTALMSRPRGFTLVELMIVVVLIGVLAAFSAPTIINSMERNRINQLNRDIGNGFLQARSHAVRNGQAVFVEIDPDGGENGRITFFEPHTSSGAWNAQSCAIASAMSPAPAPTEANTIRVIEPEGYGLDLQIYAPDPVVPMVCISPTGRVLQATGQPLAAVVGSCAGQMNLLMAIGASDLSADLTDLRDCADDIDVRIAREIDRFSLIHVAYSGQVRVLR